MGLVTAACFADAGHDVAGVDTDSVKVEALRSGRVPVFEPELELERSGDRQADVKANIQRLMHIFEGWVRRYPESYWWFNRKWDGV